MEQEKLWPTMASGRVMMELDVLFGLLWGMTLYHAIKKRGIWKGLFLVLFLTWHTAAFEHISLFFGGTHCHATSPILPAITPCSSWNSIFFYVPWLYTSIEAALRFRPHRSTFMLMVGMLVFGFGTVYEMQGPIQQFWNWPYDNGIIAESASILHKWHGYNPFGLDPTEQMASIDTSGVFRVSPHAQQALQHRAFEFPILAPYFHFAYGFAWALGFILTGPLTPTTTIPLWRWVTSGILSPILFLIPIEITRGITTHIFQWPYSIGVPFSLFLSFLPPLYSIYQSPSPKKNDILLFSISFLMHAYFVTLALFRSTMELPLGLKILVTTVGTSHLALQFYCCSYQSPTKQKLK